MYSNTNHLHIYAIPKLTSAGAEFFQLVLACTLYSMTILVQVKFVKFNKIKVIRMPLIIIKIFTV